MYRLTRKARSIREGCRLRAMREGRACKRMEEPAPAYPPLRPDLRIRITVERFDCGTPIRHVFDCWDVSRIDQYRVTVDGNLWKGRAGLSTILAGIRKSLPRLPSPRSSSI